MRPRSDDQADRIDLETKVAFLERTLEKLSSALHEQAEITAALEQRLARLEQRAESAAADPEIGPHDVPPPHY